jgi:hypothetical protein
MDLAQQLRNVDSDVARIIDDAHGLVDEVLLSDTTSEYSKLAAAISTLRWFWGPFTGRRISEEVGGYGSMGVSVKPTEYQNALEDVLQHEVLAAPCLLALAADPNCNNGCRAMAFEGLKAITEPRFSNETVHGAAEIIAVIRALVPGSILDSGKKLTNLTVRKACQLDQWVRGLPIEILLAFAGMGEEQISAVRLERK